ncbi:MAG: histidine phosphatase family protein [Candidatus Riflebacteria bacterium]|nr:histidine phosphatase family protein [Candidatus Riflebacteria bacterium]
MNHAIYLARHASPQLGWADPYNVMPGPPLSDLGRRQAGELAGYLAGESVTIVYASPFARARETAQQVAERVGCPVVESAGLREGGPGETIDDVRLRVLGVWRQIVENGHEGPVAIVSHGTPVKVVLESLDDGSAQLGRYLFDYGNPLPPGGAWRAVPRRPRWQLELAFKPSEILHAGHLRCDGRPFGAPIAR